MFMHEATEGLQDFWKGMIGENTLQEELAIQLAPLEVLYEAGLYDTAGYKRDIVKVLNKVIAKIEGKSFKRSYLL